MRILIIENTEKHIDDAKAHSKSLINCKVDLARTLTEATELLKKNNYDGVISDIFFPSEKNASEETFENAITISTQLIKMNIHHVFNTAGNHHGDKIKKFLWKTPKAIYSKSRYHLLTTGMIIESHPRGRNNEGDSKQWQAAFRYILLVHSLLSLPDKGLAIVEAARLHGFPFGEYGKLTEYFEECSHPFVVKTFQKYRA